MHFQAYYPSIRVCSSTFLAFHPKSDGGEITGISHTPLPACASSPSFLAYCIGRSHPRQPQFSCPLLPTSLPLSAATSPPQPAAKRGTSCHDLRPTQGPRHHRGAGISLPSLRFVGGDQAAGVLGKANGQRTPGGPPLLRRTT